MRDVGARMHAGIRATGDMQRDDFTRELFDRVFDRLLNRDVFDLTLPAGEIRTVIFNRQFPPRHNLLPTGKRAPRRKDAPSVAALPARWTLFNRNAPCPQATVNVSSNKVPGIEVLTP